VLDKGQWPGLHSHRVKPGTHWIRLSGHNRRSKCHLEGKKLIVPSWNKLQIRRLSSCTVVTISNSHLNNFNLENIIVWKTKKRGYVFSLIWDDNINIFFFQFAIKISLKQASSRHKPIVVIGIFYRPSSIFESSLISRSLCQRPANFNAEEFFLKK
jgi:hypothetical protein